MITVVNHDCLIDCDCLSLLSLQPAPLLDITGVHKQLVQFNIELLAQFVSFEADTSFCYDKYNCLRQLKRKTPTNVTNVLA